MWSPVAVWRFTQNCYVHVACFRKQVAQCKCTKAWIQWCIESDTCKQILLYSLQPYMSMITESSNNASQLCMFWQCASPRLFPYSVIPAWWKCQKQMFNWLLWHFAGVGKSSLLLRFAENVFSGMLDLLLLTYWNLFRFIITLFLLFHLDTINIYSMRSALMQCRLVACFVIIYVICFQVPLSRQSELILRFGPSPLMGKRFDSRFGILLDKKDLELSHRRMFLHIYTYITCTCSFSNGKNLHYFYRTVLLK